MCLAVTTLILKENNKLFVLYCAIYRIISQILIIILTISKIENTPTDPPRTAQFTVVSVVETRKMRYQLPFLNANNSPVIFKNAIIVLLTEGRSIYEYTLMV